MGRVHISHLEAGPLTRQTTRAKRRKTTLVGDFRQRVGLVHELGQLRRTEEFTHCSHNRLCVDQIVRHHCVDVDRSHAFLDCALHANETHAVCILKKFTNGTHTAVAKVVDIIDFTLPVLQIKDSTHDMDNIFFAQGAHRVRSLIKCEAKTHIHLHATNSGKVITL